MVEERFARRVIEARDELRGEMHAGFLSLQQQVGAIRADLQEQIGSVRAELHQEIGKVHEKIGEVRKEITVQTRWLVTVMVAATVLIPVFQKLLGFLVP